MFLVVLFAIALLVLFWQYILAGLGLWVVVAIVRAAVTRMDKPVRKRPAPGYLPRWTTVRRRQASRELELWQTLFEQSDR